MYPRDYQQLLDRLGGPAQPYLANFDRSVFERWESITPPAPRTWTDEELEKIKNVLGARKNPARADIKTAKYDDEEEEILPIEKQQKTRGRPRKRAKLGEHAQESARQNMTRKTERVEYVRAPAEYVAPFEQAITPSAATVEVAFESECRAGEVDPFSPYAFNGPRLRPPYRMLHDVQQPDAGDISGWAENLRWAFEQRACFWHTFQTEGWSESPEHMEAIAHTRLEQIWASDELLEHILTL
ncbi:hypothetical protein GQ44DRAFT_706952 [Phaeosphaeriaceae sp. PMI808]|nr:hypothetical protein GQ44DRAFT_706952 [Phaeosphaeriaceae sp. PMI808]